MLMAGAIYERSARGIRNLSFRLPPERLCSQASRLHYARLVARPCLRRRDVATQTECQSGSRLSHAVAVGKIKRINTCYDAALNYSTSSYAVYGGQRLPSLGPGEAGISQALHIKHSCLKTNESGFLLASIGTSPARDGPFNHSGHGKEESDAIRRSVVKPNHNRQWPRVENTLGPWGVGRKSMATMQWYANNNVHRLDWPAQSPDLNSIEHLWNELDRRAKARQERPKSIAQLMEWFQEEWVLISVDVLQTLVESMADRVAALIAARSGPTRFSRGSNHRADIVDRVPTSSIGVAYTRAFKCPHKQSLVDTHQGSSGAGMGLPITAAMTFHSNMIQPALFAIRDRSYLKLVQVPGTWNDYLDDGYYAAVIRTKLPISRGAGGLCDIGVGCGSFWVRIPVHRYDGNTSRLARRSDETLDIEVLRAVEDEARWLWSSTGMKGWGKRDIPEKTRRPAASSATIPTCKIHRVGVVARLLGSHQSEPGSIPGGGAPGSLHMGIVLDDATGRQAYSRIPHRSHTHLASPSSALKTLIGDRMQRRGKQEILEKIRRPAASYGTIRTCENPGVTPPGTEPGLFWWEASSLTTTPLRPYHLNMIQWVGTVTPAWHRPVWVSRSPVICVMAINFVLELGPRPATLSSCNVVVFLVRHGRCFPVMWSLSSCGVIVVYLQCGRYLCAMWSLSSCEVVSSSRDVVVFFVLHGRCLSKRSPSPPSAYRRLKHGLMLDVFFNAACILRLCTQKIRKHNATAYLTAASRPLHIPMMAKRGEDEAASECKGGENGRSPRNPETSGIVRHDSRMRKSGDDPAGNRTRFDLVGGEYSNHNTPTCVTNVLRDIDEIFHLALVYLYLHIGAPRYTARDFPPTPKIAARRRRLPPATSPCICANLRLVGLSHECGPVETALCSSCRDTPGPGRRVRCKQCSIALERQEISAAILRWLSQVRSIKILISGHFRRIRHSALECPGAEKKFKRPGIAPIIAREFSFPGCERLLSLEGSSGKAVLFISSTSEGKCFHNVEHLKVTLYEFTTDIEPYTKAYAVKFKRENNLGEGFDGERRGGIGGEGFPVRSLLEGGKPRGTLGANIALWYMLSACAQSKDNHASEQLEGIKHTTSLTRDRSRSEIDIELVYRAEG
ncbi:hypothetical protein PR048_027728, partial [Dryococelus australis]